MTRTLTLEELKQRSLDEILREIVEQRIVLVVRLPEGHEILLEPRSTLLPLPRLEGYVPQGWKDAVYS
jgi:hypothetical protein